MHYLSRRCLPDVLGVFVPKSPRAFHIGQCGLHVRNSNCAVGSSSTLIGALKSLKMGREKGSLYPDSLQVVDNPLSAPGFVRETVPIILNGGWEGDPRNRHLCLSISNLTYSNNKSATVSHFINRFAFLLLWTFFNIFVNN